MMKKKVTLQDIADQAHASKALVSRVLNNRPVRISDQKRDQILQIANELNYMPSGKILSVNPLPGLGKTIALLLPHIYGTFMSTIADTITSLAYKNGYNTLVFDYRQDNALEMKYLDLCKSLNVSGIILDSITDAKNNEKYIRKINEWNIPIVYLDCYPSSDDVSFVTSTNEQSMFRLTESLIARNHSNILCIIQDRSTFTNVSMSRLNGYYQAMDNHGLRGYHEIIYPKRSYNQQPVLSLLNSSTKFSAFIIHTGSDIGHFCKLIHMTSYGRDQDYELAVFDDFSIGYTDYAAGANEDVYSRIVCNMSQRPIELAENAVNILIDSMRKSSAVLPVQKFIDCDLNFPSNTHRK